MADEIPDLWPDEFKVDVQTPVTVLRVQAQALARKTRGILKAEVETEVWQKDYSQHRFVVIAPAVNGLRQTLVTVRNEKDLPYPATVYSPAINGLIVAHFVSPGSGGPGSTDVFDEDELKRTLGLVLGSKEVRAVIISLIARSNEASTAKT
jgi:hypothetical protein